MSYTLYHWFLTIQINQSLSMELYQIMKRTSLHSFKSHLKTHLFAIALGTVCHWCNNPIASDSYPCWFCTCLFTYITYTLSNQTFVRSPSSNFYFKAIACVSKKPQGLWRNVPQNHSILGATSLMIFCYRTHNATWQQFGTTNWTDQVQRVVWTRQKVPILINFTS